MNQLENMVFQFRQLNDHRGSLVSVEEERDIPFPIKRVYYIFNTKGDEPRGFHAHKELEQALICLCGSCRIVLEDGNGKRECILNDPSQALYIGTGVWNEIYDFSENCILIVLASEYYDESEYIRSYEDFSAFLAADKNKRGG